MALLGRSGSGKSTLLRSLAGLDRGVAGTGVIEVPEKVSVVFQDSRLLPWKRVLDNVTLGLRAGDALDRGRQALAEVGLAGREKAWPREPRVVSSSARRWPARWSATRSCCWPTSRSAPLDALTRIRMHTLLRKLCEVHQPAVLLVTHDVDEAIVLADRVMHPRRGVVATTRASSPRRPALSGRPGVRPAAGAAPHGGAGVEDDHDAAPARHLDRHRDPGVGRAAS